MRKGRLVFWFVSLMVCAIIILIYKEQERKIPYEEKTPINVYCMEEFQEKAKRTIEKSSIGETHRVVFIDNKKDAEFIFTDRILASDDGYEKVGWTPLIIAFDDTNDEKLEKYKEEGYLTVVESNDDDSYAIDFAKIIEDTLNGKWKDKIYCPNPDTIEGELFFDFLIININDGIYPKDEEKMNECIQKANEFLNNSVVIQLDSTERLKNKKIITNEIYIIFEKEIYDMANDGYEFEISYPTNTVVHEFYYCYRGDNKKELKKIFETQTLLSMGNILQDFLYGKYIRTDYKSDAQDISYYLQSDGFSYVEIPLKEE